MIPITKEEAKWLASKGAKYKDALHKTIGVAGHCYLTEGTKWYNMLMKRRNAQTIESHTAK